MASIKPFRAFRYNLDKVNIKDVIAPPYDVISNEKQDNLYKNSDFNVVRLILGKELSNDNKNTNKYSRAKEYLESWIREQVLIKDKEESLYIYRQCFSVDNEDFVRTGFLCLLKEEPLFKGTIYPHEKTLSKPKEDRLNLTRACRTNFSPIFGLYDDNDKCIKTIIDKVIKEEDPIIDFLDENYERNIVWKVNNQEIIKNIINFMSDKKIFIADGHHRYETSMNYTKEMHEKGIKGNFDHVLAFLCDMSDIGLKVFPTHRLVMPDKIKLEKNDFLKSLEKFFELKKIDIKILKKELNENFLNGKIAFGLYYGNDEAYILILKDKKFLDEFSGSNYYKELDVSVLENIIFVKILGFTKENIALQTFLKYEKDFNESIKLVDEKEVSLAFLMNPTKIEQIKNVALELEVMPQKSTYFYPKLLTGLVFNKFEIEE